MPALSSSQPELPGKGRQFLIFLLFFCISWGLGYPILNRYYPPEASGLSDVRYYADIVTGSAAASSEHVRTRILVPLLARPFYLLARGRSGTWNPVMFGLLMADSLFTAVTAGLMLRVGARTTGSYSVGLAGALLYLLNFAVPNLRLAGLVDAGEGLFLLALVWSLLRSQYREVPLWMLLGTLVKESFVPFGFVIAGTWWLVERKRLGQPGREALWIAGGGLLGLVTLAAVQWQVSGALVMPWEFAASLHGNKVYLGTLVSSILDRNLWYVFLWLLPLGLPKLKEFPRPWLAATGAAAVVAFALNSYYGGHPGTVGRALFSIAGPLLGLSAAQLLLPHRPTKAGISGC